MNAPHQLALALALATAAPGAVAQQTTFSIDNDGPTNAASPCSGGPAIQEGDLLKPNTASGAPELAALPPGCVDVRGGGGAGTLGLPAYPVWAEVDALSYGDDAAITATMPAGSYKFSVDEFGAGHNFAAPNFPSVRTEYPFGEVSASAFVDSGIPLVPYTIGWGPLRNVQVIDGDGLAGGSGYTTPGLGLFEPNPPGTPPDPGDNVDAMNVDGTASSAFVLFSLEGALFDPLSGVAGSGSAGFNGFLPGQILASNLSGAAPIVWATTAQLGLIAGAPSDDVDALVVWDNGNRSYDPAAAPFDWNTGAADMVLSLRRGSATLGAPDCLTGAPIEEGDILMPPIVGGLNGNPAILVPGEALGLGTRRSATGKLYAGARYADDVDALDVTAAPIFDCNGNANEDALDIAFGGECDLNKNGVPDTCELTVYCTAGTSASGCQAQIAASGTASATAATGFVLSATNVEGAKLGTFYFGTAGRQAGPWGNGTSYQCVVPPVRRGGPLAGTGTSGACDGTFSQDLNALFAAQPAKNPGAGAEVQAQLWYRDPLNTSNRTTSLSDAVEFLVCP